MLLVVLGSNYIESHQNNSTRDSTVDSSPSTSCTDLGTSHTDSSNDALHPNNSSTNSSNNNLEPIMRTPTDPVWETIEDIPLYLSDKKILISGQRLTDAHLNAAQRLLKSQYPAIGGLALTTIAYQHKMPLNAMQFFFVRDNHWIVASTIACHPGEVNIYDSLYDDQPEDVLKTICGCLVMHEPPAIVNLMKVAKQSALH